MVHLPPFNVIREKFEIKSVDGVLHVFAEYKTFLGAIRELLRAVAVDEEWYLKRYPDVVDSGMSARQHFAEHGYFEGRLPFELSVDNPWYLKTYEDVAEQISSGEMQDALTHFREHGYAEGRLPYQY